jgi:hypothetical protein
MFDFAEPVTCRCGNAMRLDTAEPTHDVIRWQFRCDCGDVFCVENPRPKRRAPAEIRAQA